MGGHRVRLLALMVLAAVWKCGEVFGLQQGSVEVLVPGAPLGCGAPTAVNVIFNDIRVPGPDSDVEFSRVAVRDLHLSFATNTSVDLPAFNFIDCAKAAAREGVPAFTYTDSCIGYHLDSKFLRNQKTGDIAVYVRLDYLTNEARIVPFDAAPYKKMNDSIAPFRLYMLSQFVVVDKDHPRFPTVDEFQGYYVHNGLNVVLGKEGWITSHYLLLDVEHCFSDGAYSVPIAVAQDLLNIEWPVVYFMNECGKTIKIPEIIAAFRLVLLSHPGFGCEYLPSDFPDKCSVTFVSENPLKTGCTFGFFFPETNSDAAGLNFTITGETPQAPVETKDVFQSNSFGFLMKYATYTVTLESKPSKRAIGFTVNFTPVR